MASITYLSNAGVILDLNGHTLMVDGLYCAEGLPFSDIPPGLLEKHTADCLAFTHTHHDHMDRGRLEAYLAAHAVKSLILPPRVRLEPGAAEVHVMKGTEGTVELLGMTVRWCRTPHLDHARPEHHSFVVTGGGAAVLVAGDAMPSREYFARMTAGTRIDAALITPLFFQDASGRALLEEVIRPDQVLLYHIPRPEDDVHGLARMAARQVERWGACFRAAALTCPGERIAVGP